MNSKINIFSLRNLGFSLLIVLSLILPTKTFAYEPVDEENVNTEVGNDSTSTSNEELFFNSLEIFSSFNDSILLEIELNQLGETFLKSKCIN